MNDSWVKLKLVEPNAGLTTEASSATDYCPALYLSASYSPETQNEAHGRLIWWSIPHSPDPEHDQPESEPQVMESWIHYYLDKLNSFLTALTVSSTGLHTIDGRRGAVQGPPAAKAHESVIELQFTLGADFPEENEAGKRLRLSLQCFMYEVDRARLED
ncbi:hypothetical protein PVAR5_1980 [Paecilomyces variotii No. 5]|uniref:Uncharacterized protein n=1 Tax=Byssochlamys spectabilis (strain No. 5 / NBRC 109023) TaxID=1356009 RepID=V5HUR8_BYSSN|nr:hypothetical protein PVAR5_1980 [Paecilomyces variotii No. 5]